MPKKKKSEKNEQPKEPKRRPIDRALLPSEEVLIRALPWRGAVWHKYLLTLGLYGIWRNRRPMIVTDHRVLIGTGIITRTEQSIPLSRIDGAVYVRVGPVGYCDVHYTTHRTRQSERLGPLSPFKARQFANTINGRV
jgi:PH (Pleckstrin Homology) domain-containing protein